MSETHATEPGALIRSYREGAGLSLDALADILEQIGYERPSVAKLSRIETGRHPVSIDILPGLAAVTGIPASKLRPELAAIFDEAAQ
jgi:transcriptional regulator with XRE-family HTH domain